MIFGAADSPFQAITAIKTLVQEKRKQGNLSEIEQKVCDMLGNNTYKDDLTITGDTITEVHAIYEGIVELLGEANFKVKKMGLKFSDSSEKTGSLNIGSHRGGPSLHL